MVTLISSCRHVLFVLVVDRFMLLVLSCLVLLLSLFFTFFIVVAVVAAVIGLRVFNMVFCIVVIKGAYNVI